MRPHRPDRPGGARRAVRPRRRRRGAGAHRRRVADAAAALPVAEPHRRRRPGAGPARLPRVVAASGCGGSACRTSALASLRTNYRTPREVMAHAEPVIRAALPDANVPTSVRSSGLPVVHGSTSGLPAVVDRWLAEHAGRDRLRRRRPDVRAVARGCGRCRPSWSRASSSTSSCSSTRSPSGRARAAPSTATSR